MVGNRIAAAALVAGALAGALCSCASAAEDPRTWIDTAGRKVEATFVRVFNGEVILDKDGQMLKVPLARFSAADQQYIRNASNPARGPAATTRDRPPAGTSSKSPTADQKPADNDQPAAADKDQARQASIELRRIREWKDAAGNAIRARFERFTDQQVVLMQGNRAHKVDFSRLSAADQAFLTKNFEAQGRAAELPTAPPAASNNPADAQLAGGSAPGPANPFNAGRMPPAGLPALPAFGDVASQIRSQQEQMRATHDQMRAQFEQMRTQVENARARVPRPGFPAATVPPSQPVVDRHVPPAPQIPSERQVSIASTQRFQTPADSSTPDRPAGAPFEASIRSARPSHPTSLPLAAEASLPANDPFAAVPLAGPHYQEVVICGACQKEQKPGFKAGDRCQHCGRIIDEITDSNGKVVDRSVRATGRNIKFWVWAVITVIDIIGGVITKLKKG
jgi:SLA1 homology domain 1, SHD1